MPSLNREIDDLQCIVYGCQLARSLMAMSLSCGSLPDGLLAVQLLSWTESAGGQSVWPLIRISRVQPGRRKIADEGTPLLAGNRALKRSS